MPTKPALPMWASPDRKAKLVELFARSGGFCIFGHRQCPNPEHYYEVFIEGLIADWKADDREARAFEYKLESLRLHHLAEPRTPIRGQFSAISRDIYNADKPLYYLEGIAISGVTLEPFIRVRLSSSYMRLYVKLGYALRGISKSRKRKSIRYGKPLPPAIMQTVTELVKQSVNDYFKH